MENEERIAKKNMPGIIKRYRALAGLSQQQLADSMGVSKGFISALKGGRSVPNLDMLVVAGLRAQCAPWGARGRHGGGGRKGRAKARG